jgi:hypothetical protein
LKKSKTVTSRLANNATSNPSNSVTGKNMEAQVIAKLFPLDNQFKTRVIPNRKKHVFHKESY